jgi:excisionase family DNA binding protein
MRSEAKVITIGELCETIGELCETICEPCEYLRVHRSTIYRLLKKGQLPGFKIGSDWRFNREAINSWRLQQYLATEKSSGNKSRAHDRMSIEH